MDLVWQGMMNLRIKALKSPFIQHHTHCQRASIAVLENTEAMVLCFENSDSSLLLDSAIPKVPLDAEISGFFYLDWKTDLYSQRRFRVAFHSRIKNNW